jgi:hypothetical protein
MFLLIWSLILKLTYCAQKFTIKTVVIGRSILVFRPNVLRTDISSDRMFYVPTSLQTECSTYRHLFRPNILRTDISSDRMFYVPTSIQTEYSIYWHFFRPNVLRTDIYGDVFEPFTTSHTWFGAYLSLIPMLHFALFKWRETLLICASTNHLNTSPGVQRTDVSCAVFIEEIHII